MTLIRGIIDRDLKVDLL